MDLNDEVICGHLVTAEQKKINAVFLDLLREFGRLCENAGLTWWMYAGGLIGAVRHKGFVPWDDDVDVMLPRKDFDRLQSMTNEQFGAKPPYFLQNPVTDPLFNDYLIRFRRSDTSFVTRANWLEAQRQAEGCPYDMGLHLSVFPIDNVPVSPALYKLQIWTQGVMASLYYRAFAPDRRRPVRSLVSRGLLKALGPLRFARLCSFHYRMTKSTRSGRVQIFSGRYSMCTEYALADFQKTLTVPFEDITIPIPSGYDGFLRATYGDYMTFPPAESRVPPHDAVASAEVPYEETIRHMRAGLIPLPACWGNAE